jgi:hypothetical protein
MIALILVSVLGMDPSAIEFQVFKKQAVKQLACKWSDKNIMEFYVEWNKGIKEKELDSVPEEFKRRACIVGMIAFEVTASKAMGLKNFENYIEKNVISEKHLKMLDSKEFSKKLTVKTMELLKEEFEPEDSDKEIY